MIVTRRFGKYNAKKVAADGEIFDSGLEYRRYLELKMLTKAGLVKCFTIHPTFTLLPSFKHMSYPHKIRAMTYSADFLIVYTDGTRRVEDTKGFMTEASRNRIKMFLYQNPDLDFRIVKSKDVKTLKELKK